MLKNGSRIGYLFDPHKVVCSKICATPVSSIGTVLKPTLNALFESSAPMCSQCAPVFTCFKDTETTW